MSKEYQEFLSMAERRRYEAKTKNRETMSTDTTTSQLEASVESLRDTINVLNDILIGEATATEIEQEAEDYGIEMEDDNGHDLVRDILGERALEIYGNARVTPDSVDIRSYTVVMSTGGPHIEFIAGYRGTVEIVGYWGSDRIERFTDAGALTEYIAEMMGGWDR